MCEWQLQIVTESDVQLSIATIWDPILELVRKIFTYENDAAQSLIRVLFRPEIIPQLVIIKISYVKIFHEFENWVLIVKIQCWLLFINLSYDREYYFKVNSIYCNRFEYFTYWSLYYHQLLFPYIWSEKMIKDLFL